MSFETASMEEPRDLLFVWLQNGHPLLLKVQAVLKH
jgi:hypothetical protein